MDVPWRLKSWWWYWRDLVWTARGYLHSEHWREERRRNGHRKHALEHSDFLNGATWRWETWHGRPAIDIDPDGVETPGSWDHDHCHFCYEVGFSESYDVDLREGWTTTHESGPPEDEEDEDDRIPDGYQWWVCPECFDLYREQHSWTVEA